MQRKKRSFASLRMTSVVLRSSFFHPCHPEERQRRRICFRRPAGAEEKILRFAQDDNRRKALRMTGEEVLRMTGADRLSVLCHPEERQRRRICFRRPAGAEEKILRFAQDDNRRKALRMTGEEVLRMTGADRLSVLCHPEERQRRRICFRRPAGAEKKILRFAQDDKRGECSV